MGLDKLLRKKFLLPFAVFSALSLPVLSCDTGPTEPEPRNNPPEQEEPNRPAYGSISCPSTIKEREFFQAEMTGTDPEGQPVYYSPQDVPDWLSITSNFVSGFAPEVIQDTPENLVVKVLDQQGAGETLSCSFMVEDVRNTDVINQETANKIVSTSGDSLVFSEPVDFTIGYQLVADTSSAFPKGSLMEVTGISDDKKTLYIKRGDFGKAIGEGEVSYSHTFRMSQLASFSGLEGASMGTPASSISKEFGVDLNNVVVYDADGNLSTTNDQLIANGRVTFNASMDLDIEVHDYVLHDFELTNNIRVNSDMTLGSNTFGTAQTKRISLANYSFTPLVFPIGFIPVVITPQINVNLTVDPTKTNILSVNVEQEASLETILSYDGEWNASGNLENSFEFSNPVFSGDWELSAFAGPSIDFKLYGVAGPFAGAGLGLIFESNSSNTANLYGGFRAFAGVSVGLLKNVSAYSKLVVDERWPLAEISGPSEKIFFDQVTDSGMTDIFHTNPDGTGKTNLTQTSNVSEMNPFPFPDGTQIVYELDRDIWRMDADGRNKVNLTNTPNKWERFPSVSSQGTHISYSLDGDLWKMDKNGWNRENLTSSFSPGALRSSWSPNGKQIVFDAGPSFEKDIYRIEVDTKNVTRLTNRQGVYAIFSEHPSWSPNGDYIAIISRRCNSQETLCGRDIYLIDPANGEFKGRITNNWGSTKEVNPAWSPDGTKLVYRTIIPDGSGKFTLRTVNADATENKGISGSKEFGRPQWGKIISSGN